MPGAAEQRTRRFPVVELFGPTIQGEGPDAGRPCLFVRFGGCDYRCSWCDSMHAVDPGTVRREARRLSTGEITSELLARPGVSGGMLVVLSGGNPALYELDALVEGLHEAGMRVSVETQGSVWRDWLGAVDLLVVSPKPPSSGMATGAHEDRGADFLSRAASARHGRRATVLKIVCFDATDLEWAYSFRAAHPDPHGSLLPLYLSAGTDVDREPSPRDLQHRFRWLCEVTAVDPRARDCVVLPQLHVLAWGSEKER